MVYTSTKSHRFNLIIFLSLKSLICWILLNESSEHRLIQLRVKLIDQSSDQLQDKN